MSCLTLSPTVFENMQKQKSKHEKVKKLRSQNHIAQNNEEIFTDQFHPTRINKQINYWNIMSKDVVVEVDRKLKFDFGFLQCKLCIDIYLYN